MWTCHTSESSNYDFNSPWAQTPDIWTLNDVTRTAMWSYCERVLSVKWVTNAVTEALHSREWRITHLEAYVCQEIASSHGRVWISITRTQNRSSFPHQPCYGRRHCAIIQKGAGSIPVEVIRFSNWPNPSIRIIALEVVSVSKGNEYQKSSWE
jgi:hypothetical protein